MPLLQKRDAGFSRLGPFYAVRLSDEVDETAVEKAESAELAEPFLFSCVSAVACSGVSRFMKDRRLRNVSIQSRTKGSLELTANGKNKITARNLGPTKQSLPLTPT